MKTLAITASLVAALSAPAFANDNLAASVGVEPGLYTVAELIQLRDALEGNDQVEAAFILNGNANPVDGAVAYEARLRQAEEDGDYAIAAYLRNSGSEVISTQSFGQNDVAARIFAELAAAD
jgi:hypothetical protein